MLIIITIETNTGWEDYKWMMKSDQWAYQEGALVQHYYYKGTKCIKYHDTPPVNYYYDIVANI